MMHVEQKDYVLTVRSRYPEFFRGTRVLEAGSKNVNGSIRPFFEDCEYVGLDCCPGPMVDVVCLAHEYKPDKLFDVIATCELLEHDPHWRQTIPHLLSLLRPGGLLVGTWGGPTRAEHGTRRTEDAGGIWGPLPDYYGNVSEQEFAAVAAPYFDFLEVQTAREGQDVYAVGIRNTVGIPQIG